MFCIHCGSQIPDGSAFCTSCGNRLAPEAEPTPVAPPPVERGTEVLSDTMPYEEDTVALSEDTSVLAFEETILPIDEPAAPVFQPPIQEAYAPPVYQEPIQEAYVPPVYQAPVQEQPVAPVYSAPEPEAPKATFCTHCNGPINAGSAFCPLCGTPQKPAKPAQNTEKPKGKMGALLGLIIGGAAAAMLVIALIIGLCTNWFGLYGPATKIVAATNKTVKSGSFTVDMEFEYDSSYGSSKREMTFYVIIDAEERELMVYGCSEDEEGNQYELAIYDGYYITHNVYSSNHEYYDCYSIEDELEEIFDGYDSGKDMDLEELFDLIDEETDGGLSDVLNAKKTVKCAKKYVRKLNSNKWLKDNAGFSTTKENGVKLYTFSPKPYTFLNASLECFEDAFEDEDDYEDLMDEMKDSKKYINEVDVDITLGIKGGKLVSAEIKTDDMKYEMEFKNIGSTSIDEGDLDDLLNEARDYNSEW